MAFFGIRAWPDGALARFVSPFQYRDVFNRRTRPCINHRLFPIIITRYYAGFEIRPERDEQLACLSHNGDPPRAPSQRADALAELLCHLATDRSFRRTM